MNLLQAIVTCFRPSPAPAEPAISWPRPPPRPISIQPPREAPMPQRYKLRPLKLVDLQFARQTQRELDRASGLRRVETSSSSATLRADRGPTLSFDGSAEGLPLSPVSPANFRAGVDRPGLPHNVSSSRSATPPRPYLKKDKGKGRAGPPPVEPLNLPPALVDAPRPRGEDQVRVPSPSGSGGSSSSSSHYSVLYG